MLTNKFYNRDNDQKRASLVATMVTQPLKFGREMIAYDFFDCKDYRKLEVQLQRELLR
jgi:hypothetical protein